MRLMRTRWSISRLRRCFEKRITKSQEGGTQYTVALRDDNGDIMHVVEMGVRGWERKI
jgi:hypothetical protein